MSSLFDASRYVFRVSLRDSLIITAKLTTGTYYKNKTTQILEEHYTLNENLVRLKSHDLCLFTKSTKTPCLQEIRYTPGIVILDKSYREQEQRNLN